jgi:hypothetical protein
MLKINLSVPHTLGQDEAKKRISKLIADTRDQLGSSVTNLHESWSGYIDTFSFRAMGFSVDGQLEVQPSDVLIQVNLPLAALLFKSRIESEILRHARELLTA